MILRVVDVLVQRALGLGDIDARGGIADNIERGDEHLDGAVDGEDQAVGQHCRIIHIAEAGEDGEKDDRAGAGGRGRTGGGDECEQRDDDELGEADAVARAAGDEERCDDLHDGRSVHVDGHAERQDEGGDLLIHAELLDRGLDVERERRRTRRGGEAEDRDAGDLLGELERIKMREDRDESGIADDEEDEQQHNREDDIGDGGLEVLDTVGGKGAREQHEDGNGAELADDEVEEDDDHVVEFLNELAKRGSLLLAERLHAKAQRDGEEDDGEHCRVARKRRGNVRGDDVQHNEQRIGARRTGNALQPVDGDVEYAHVIEDDAADAGEQERKKRTDQETLDTLEGNSAKCTGIRDLSYCQCNGSKHHRHDDELEGTNEHLTGQIEKAKRAARSGSGDILE